MDGMVEVSFMYNDEYGNDTKIDKTITGFTYESPFEMLVDEFKRFLLAASFPQKLVDTIQIVEESDEEILKN